MKRLLALFFIITELNASAQSVTPFSLRSSKEWHDLERRITFLMKKSPCFERGKDYDLFPIFWMAIPKAMSLGGNGEIINIDGDKTRIDVSHLSFSYYPRCFPNRIKKYIRCTVLIAEKGIVIAVADALMVQPVSSVSDLERKVLESYVEGGIDAAFFLGAEVIRFDRVYCVKDNSIAVLDQQP